LVSLDTPFLVECAVNLPSDFLPTDGVCAFLLLALRVELTV
jgi:hypothetical protein